MVNRSNKRIWWFVAGAIAVVAVAVAIVAGVQTVSAGAPQERPDAGDAGSVDAAGGEGSESLSPDASAIGGTNDLTSDQEIAEFVPNEVIVTIDDPAVLETLVPGASIGDAKIVGVDVITEDDGESVVKLTLEGDESVDSTLDALNAMDGVEAQKNFIYHLM